eukprot:TRINITY_DN29160_c0_g1_i1.p1 TRINITY_DN29160_c0_g1~~TRINITY_DN29160_c0_g1_i1.p1  ORF type:complete len:116 (+),score=5.79 TRINITY_DN29160_c0_g1_i1:162-509(+)
MCIRDSNRTVFSSPQWTSVSLFMQSSLVITLTQALGQRHTLYKQTIVDGVVAPQRQQVLYRSRPVSYTHLRAHETPEHLVCRLLLEKKKTPTYITKNTTVISFILTIYCTQYCRY